MLRARQGSASEGTKFHPRTFFLTECPTCGRPQKVNVRYLGMQVFCQNCRSAFDACDQPSDLQTPFERAEQILKHLDAADPR